MVRSLDKARYQGTGSNAHGRRSSGHPEQKILEPGGRQINVGAPLNNVYYEEEHPSSVTIAREEARGAVTMTPPMDVLLTCRGTTGTGQAVSVQVIQEP